MAKAEFVQQVYEAAIRAGLTDPAARVMASQAALESNYGQSAPGNNIFGIKAGKSWTGDTQVLTTHEGSGENRVKTKATFRAYPSVDAAIADRVQFMADRFPAFNQAQTTGDAYDALLRGKYGRYYTDSSSTYERNLDSINSTYLSGIPTPPVGIPSDFSTMAQANINAAAMPPLPIPRPQTPNGGQVRGANTGTMFKVGDLVPSKDGVHTLRVVDKGNGVAGFEQVRSPFDIPGVLNVSQEMKAPTIVGDYIRNAMKNVPKPDLAPVTQTVQNAAGATQSTVGNAVKQGTSALGDFGNSAVNMLGGLFNSAPKAPTPPASIPSAPANSGWATAWHASPMPVQAPAAPTYTPTMPTGGPGTFPAAGLPAAPYMPTMPTGGPGTYGPAGMPAAPILPMAPTSLTQQIGTPPGTQLRMTVNRAPSPPPVQMTQIATGKRVPVGTVTPHGGVVQANGSINHGSWSTPGPGQDLKWWQANSMGYTV